MVGKNIRQLRVSANFTQDEMARELNLKKNDIANWELERNNPRIESAIIIAKYFKVTLDDLYLKDLAIENNSISNSEPGKRDHAEVPEDNKHVNALDELIERMHRMEELVIQSEERMIAQLRDLEAKYEANSKLMWAGMDKLAERTQKMYQLLGALTVPAKTAGKGADQVPHRNK